MLEVKGNVVSYEELNGAVGGWIERVTFNREFCAQLHIDCMDQYFEDAETINSIKRFWGENSPFREKFIKLDLRNVIELACGRGRHVPHYLQKAGEVTLVDILEENIQKYLGKKIGDYVKNVMKICVLISLSLGGISKFKNNLYKGIFRVLA